jgi:hypothetical protein
MRKKMACMLREPCLCKFLKTLHIAVLSLKVCVLNHDLSFIGFVTLYVCTVLNSQT